DSSSSSAVTRFIQPDSWKKFGTGFFGAPLEASGVQGLADWNGVLLVSDNRNSSVVWMQLDETGQQVGQLKDIPLGVTFKDPESITYSIGYFYVVTSQADPKDSAANAIIRFGFNPSTQALSAKPEVITDFRSFLLKNVTEISSIGAPPGTKGGL